jgi:uncharacterized protein YbjT (DUF2867 family)
MSERARPERLILIAGASGYVGGRLLKALEARGERLRCLARRPDFLRPRVAPTTEVVEGDVQNLESLREAMRDVDAVYYLVHSMGSATNFAEQDRRAATNFAKAAREAGVRRIVYLGGLGSGPDLSPHLASRQEVGRILRESGVATIEFRASIIIGSGSLSFEMIRSLVDRLPIMITPRWVRSRAQPIAIEDVITYLVAALDLPVDCSTVVEIGGADQVSYRVIMREYGRQRGLRRLMIPVPVLTPRLSSLWLGLVTPVYASIGRDLIDSIPHETLVNDDTAARLFEVRPRGIKESIARALTNEDQELAVTRWSGALSSRESERRWGGMRFGSRLVDSRSARVPVHPERAFAPIQRIGGETRWYYGGWLWRLRGLLDLLVGGAGLKRGRRDPEHLLPGDTVDFWRVEDIEPDRMLRLYAEMKLPGRAWLQFDVEPDGEGSVIRQTSIFDPVGLPGLLYWYGLYPMHALVFAGMLRGIARAATRKETETRVAA